MTATGKLVGLSVIAIAIMIVGLVWWLLPEPVPAPEIVEVAEVVEVVPDPEPVVTESVIGSSVEGRDIAAVTFGAGNTRLLFVGGVHGGYEWNSSLLAYEMIDHLTANPELIPEDISVTIIPSLNPDGMYMVTGKAGRFTAADITDPSVRVAEARFNANGVDLNRNFACKWAPESTWRGEVVSAGESAFSEPEAVALRTFIEANPPEVVAFWHSQANNVYASECEDGVLPETLQVMETYAVAGDYGQVPVFDAYPITGDAEGWLASLGIPAVTVELETHNSIEWSRNLAGTQALINQYSIAK